MPEFDAWLASIRNMTTRQRLLTRLRRAARGNLGDIRPIGGRIFEMRQHFGPGWRMYFARYGDSSIVMLCGGDKASQRADVALARRRERLILE
ncbi:MAG: type II toxin-antitoxin system RelE/ParE family toxin [Chromatiales bacterium]|nr:type II toxin-antitoxin system RelE/ParE family toxin [Chromatiales bacterium]